MEPLIDGAILAAASALGFLAYKHPKAYLSVHWKLVWTDAALIWALAIWNISNTTTWLAAKPYVPAPQVKAAIAATDLVEAPMWLLLGFCAAGIYFFVLWRVSDYFEKNSA